MKLLYLINLSYLLFYSFQNFAQPCGACGTKGHENFWLLKREGFHTDTSKVKVEGIYLNKYIDSNGKITYSYYKFYRNGRVFISCEFCTFPTEKDRNNVNHGIYGEYKIVENNTVKIEQFAPYPRYYYSYFDISNDSLTYKYTQSRKKFGQAKKENVPKLVYIYQKL